jgi:tetrathionate reductase subunit B
MSDTKQMGMLIDLSLCIGCNACTVACKIENDVPLTKFNTWIESFDVEGSDGRIRRANIPKLCNHCKDAPCVTVCPTGASYRNEDGYVLVDHSRCIGCKYCMAACPYSVRWVDDSTGEVSKCTFCYHRTSEGLLPACVATCVTGARMFGDFGDPDSDVSKRLAEAGGGDDLLEDMDLHPSVHYIGLKDTQNMPVASAVVRGGNVYEPYKERR